ncbi:MAG: tRNA dihydrouridine synthase DusB [Treponema sp.]|nr:tRNA dihydrouridine synthase DusB [Treponema sp.]
MTEFAGLYRPLRIGPLKLSGNLLLAPVAGYSNRSFRRLCIEQGANLGFTELISAESLYRNPESYGLGPSPAASKVRPDLASLVARASNERQYAVQLFSGCPESVYRAAAMLAPLAPEVLDINAGCPVPKVVKHNGGSALMKEPDLLARVVEAAVRASRDFLGSVPVTIKIRSGWDSSSLNYPECGRLAVEAGAAMVSLHPRTRSQGYSGRGDWSLIADLASRLPVPVTGSGDLNGPEDAARMLAETGCAAVMFARGAMGNPTIFAATRSFLETGTWQEPEPIGRFRMALAHLRLLAEDLGERSACLEMRKQFPAYIKGVPKAAAIRARAVRACTFGEFESLAELLQDQQK